jgi:hypothetical protein
MGSAMYADAGTAPTADTGPAASDDEGIVDAEIVDDGPTDSADDSEEGKQ